MNLLFHDEWNQKRLKKTINIFGKDWFFGKNILELGACHGNFGFELLKLGANVTFTDARENNLKPLQEKCNSLSYPPKIKILNQENNYDLGMRFDLVIHFGVLYNLENWKQDLKCALSHSDIMLLDSMVIPSEEMIDKKVRENKKQREYDSFSGVNSIFSEHTVEKELTDLGCKFLKFKDPDLNNKGWDHNSHLYQIYDWEYEDIKNGVYSKIDEKMINGIFTHAHARRMWLVLR